MRIFKLVGALLVVLAFSAVAVATASAAETLWRWLPGSVGETFKGTQISKEAVLTVEGGVISIKCKKATILLEGSELTEKGDAENKKAATLGLATFHFSECTVSGGFSVNSLGDKPGIILTHVELHNCVISKVPLEFGLLVLPLETHLEVPAVALLITVFEKGLFIARIKEEAGGKKHNFLITAKSKEAGKAQDPEKCEGGEKEVLKTKIDNNAEQTATEDGEFLIEFDLTFDEEGEIIMV
jgi:hypothetical protein